MNYLPNPIPLQIFPYKRDEVNIHSILWVRAFSSVYNPFLAIEIIRILKEKYSDIKLTMIGPDKCRLAECKNLINLYELEENIQIIGSIPNNKLYQYYQNHQVFLNTTSYESFGVSLFEAASCGIPIVTTNVGEIPYIWENEKEIFTISTLNPETFAKKISNIFEDVKLASKLSINARKKASMIDNHLIKVEWLKIVK